MDAFLTVVWGVVVLVVLVVIHELGHFVAARAFGVRVTEFMIGMPGPNIGFEHNGCRYGITCIPLGGYNRITGMEGGEEDPNLATVLAYVYRHGKTDVEHVALGCELSQDDAEFALVVLDGWGSINKPGRSNKTGLYCAPKTKEYELGEAREVEDPVALLDAERKQTYRGLSLWKRLVVLFAGPLMNILLALVLIVVAFCGIGTSYYTSTIGEVIEGQPAIEAGLQAGDTITSVNGTEVSSLSGVTAALANSKAGDEVDLVYTRDGQENETTLKLGENEEGRAIIGFYPAVGTYRMSVPDALLFSGQLVVMTVQSYANLINPTTMADTVSQSSSVVGISVMAKQAADAGVVMLLYVMAAISLCLGVVNLVPVPPLDGGKIVTEVVEKVSRRYIPVKVINATTIVFIALMLLLFVVLTRQDIINYVLGGANIFN